MYFTKNEDGTYTEVTDALIPASEVAAIKAKNTELRTTNNNLLKSNESLSAFADVLDGATNVTPEALTAKIDAKAAARAEQMLIAAKAKYEGEVNELKTQLNSTGSHLSKLVLGTEVTAASMKHGVLGTATSDILARAESVFTVKDGKTVARDELARDATGNPLNINTWMENVAKEAPHLFAQSKGPAIQRNSTTRVAVPADGVKRSGMDMIAAGLANKTSKSL